MLNLRCSVLFCCADPVDCLTSCCPMSSMLRTWQSHGPGKSEHENCLTSRKLLCSRPHIIKITQSSCGVGVDMFLLIRNTIDACMWTRKQQCLAYQASVRHAFHRFICSRSDLATMAEFKRPGSYTSRLCCLLRTL